MLKPRGCRTPAPTGGTKPTPIIDISSVPLSCRPLAATPGLPGGRRGLAPGAPRPGCDAGAETRVPVEAGEVAGQLVPPARDHLALNDLSGRDVRLLVQAAAVVVAERLGVVVVVLGGLLHAEVQVVEEFLDLVEPGEAPGLAVFGQRVESQLQVALDVLGHARVL